ncbi:MAG: hypothetical protein ABI912_11430 [Actinomycetota bacterium]
MLCLLGAVLAFGTASLFQAKGARRSSGHRNGLQFLLGLVTSGPYAFGTALDLGAVLLTAYALRDLPLFFVQAATSSSLAVTALGSALLYPGERRPGTWRAVISVSLGLALLGSSAAQGESTGLATGRILVLAAGVPLLLLAHVVLGRSRVPGRTRYAVLAGLAYAGMGVSLRALHGTDSLLLTLRQPAALTAAGFLSIALFFFGRALQHGSVTTAMAIVVCLDTLLPAGVGLWLLGDHTRPGWGPATVAGLLVTVTGLLMLVRATADDSDEPVAEPRVEACALA